MEQRPGPSDSPADSDTTFASIAIPPHVGSISFDEAAVWTRLSENGTFRVVWEDPEGTTGSSDWVRTSDDSDHAGLAHLRDLIPSTTYRYHVELPSGEQSEERQFRTLAPPGEGTARVLIIADAMSSHPDSPTYAEIPNHNADLVLQIGDFDHRNPYDLAGLDREAWWDMWRDVLWEDPAGQALDAGISRSLPLMMMWDDHDYGDDNGSSKSPFRDVARSAFLPYLGREPQADGSFWVAIHDGPLDIFLLDLRSDRSDDHLPDSNQKTMLGISQWDWLKSELQQSQAPYKLIASSVPFNPTPGKPDAWYGYETERQMILHWLAAQDIQGVVMVSGDIHSGGAIDDGTNAGVPEMNVPTTNMPAPHCTAATCGIWSDGLYDEQDRTGFGMVEVSPKGGTTDCVLTVFDETGKIRLRKVFSK